MGRCSRATLCCHHIVRPIRHLRSILSLPDHRGCLISLACRLDQLVGVRGGSKQVARWADSPSLSVVTGSAADRVHLNELVPILNQDLGPTPIQVVADGDDSADIRVYFTPLADFTAIGQQHGFPVVPGNWGYFYMFWDADQALTKTFVLLATDKLSGDQLRHFTFEELTQSLDLATDSDIFPDSIFYANGADGGDATELSALDRRLLWLLYAHTQPGDDQAAFDAAFDQYF